MTAYFCWESVKWVGDDNHVYYSHIFCIHCMPHTKTGPCVQFDANLKEMSKIWQKVCDEKNCLELTGEERWFIYSSKSIHINT